VAEVRRTLAACRTEGPAVILVEHRLDLVAALADTVTVLERGRVVARGSPDALATDPVVARAFMEPAR
jgi:branched-chain amino acid transport system ATP-binding protein